MIEIPRRELNELSLARGKAQDLAAAGHAGDGLALLDAGLDRARRLPAETPWRDALLGRWREARELFAELHKIRID